MAEIIFKSNGAISLGSIDSEDDLKPRPRMNINPPPSDGRCECCGKHISELEPYGKAGDPLVGDFNGAFLVKKWRPMYVPNEEESKIIREHDEFFKTGEEKDIIKMLNEQYGEENGEGLWVMACAAATYGSSWECRECIILENDEYFEKRREASLNNRIESDN